MRHETEVGECGGYDQYGVRNMVYQIYETEEQFKVIDAKDQPIGADGSRHYRMSKGKHYVDFGVFEGEMAAYLWGCPNEGRVFLKALEAHAAKNGWKLTIPTVLSIRLEKILKDNGYIMKEVPYIDDVCELWSKE